MSGVDVSGMMAAFARLKGVPLEKVLRNASRDYVQGAYRATPTAQISKSAWYRAEKNGKVWYIPESAMAGRKIKRVSDTTIRKLRIKKGWSKATWLGAMQALGMSSMPKRLPSRLNLIVQAKSDAKARTSNGEASFLISDEFRVDAFGRESTRPAHESIAAAGFKLAAERMTREFERMIKRLWK